MRLKFNGSGLKSQHVMDISTIFTKIPHRVLNDNHFGRIDANRRDQWFEIAVYHEYFHQFQVPWECPIMAIP